MSIIEGTIYNEKKELIFNAVIKITEINPETKLIKEMGYTTTDINGKYAFSIDAYINNIYQLTIYPPLNK